jgi:PAS domain-containing protein
MGPTLLEYSIDADGCYIDANAELLAATGYTELSRLSADDPLRPIAEAQVADLRGRYRELQPTSELGTAA